MRAPDLTRAAEPVPIALTLPTDGFRAGVVPEFWLDYFLTPGGFGLAFAFLASLLPWRDETLTRFGGGFRKFPPPTFPPSA